MSGPLWSSLTRAWSIKEKRPGPDPVQLKGPRPRGLQAPYGLQQRGLPCWLTGSKVLPNQMLNVWISGLFKGSKYCRTTHTNNRVHTKTRPNFSPLHELLFSSIRDGSSFHVVAVTSKPVGHPGTLETVGGSHVLSSLSSMHNAVCTSEDVCAGAQ